jgi:hypothetical protein
LCGGVIISSPGYRDSQSGPIKRRSSTRLRTVATTAEDTSTAELSALLHAPMPAGRLLQRPIAIRATARALRDSRRTSPVAVNTPDVRGYRGLDARLEIPQRDVVEFAQPRWVPSETISGLCDVSYPASCRGRGGPRPGRSSSRRTRAMRHNRRRMRIAGGDFIRRIGVPTQDLIANSCSRLEASAGVLGV